jgi:hypothetical protein
LRPGVGRRPGGRGRLNCTSTGSFIMSTSMNSYVHVRAMDGSTQAQHGGQQRIMSNIIYISGSRESARK